LHDFDAFLGKFNATFYDHERVIDQTSGTYGKDPFIH
jgi:hypothetical protein